MNDKALKARQWRIVELPLKAKTVHPHPFPDVRVTADFSGPAGEHYRIPGFLDGGNTWLIRFTPTTPGRWTYRTTCNITGDAGLHGRHGSLNVEPPAGDNPLYRHGGFLRVSPNKRHLTYTDGTPFFWLGDTWWFCPSDLMPFDSAFRMLIDKRRKQGFSVVQMAFLGRLTPKGTQSGITGEYGQLFADEVNTEYWHEVDRYLSYANESGILPVIGLGFHHGLDTTPLAKLKKLWAYVLARYGSHAVSWLICGEYNAAQVTDETGGVPSETDTKRCQKVLKLGQFIKDHDPYARAMTVHPWWYKQEGREAWTRPWHDFIMLQGGHEEQGPPPAFYTGIYHEATKPLLEGECTYEGIRGFPDTVVRHNAYKAIQCGSCGFTYGSHGLWYPNQDETDLTFNDWGPPIPWRAAAERPGAAQMTHLRACYEAVPWFKLAPVDAASVIAWTDKDCSSGLPPLAAAAGDECILVYLPARKKGVAPMRPVFIGGTSGMRYKLTLFNPRTGKSVETGQSPVGGGSTPLRALPDAGDWMLVFRAATAVKA